MQSVLRKEVISGTDNCVGGLRMIFNISFLKLFIDFPYQDFCIIHTGTVLIFFLFSETRMRCSSVYNLNFHFVTGAAQAGKDRYRLPEAA